MTTISAQELIASLQKAIATFPDKRTGANCRYSLSDIVLGAFSVFFTQSPSFLSYQKALQETQSRNNAQSLFGLEKIPSDNHIRDILDAVNPSLVIPVFRDCLTTLIKEGLISSFKTEIGYCVAIDGTGYFSSDTLHCQNCLTKTDKKGKKTYYHSLLTPVLVKDREEHVLSLPPEFITPQDGKEKQDCENMAAKRWVRKFGEEYSSLGTTILGDDLYSRQLFISLLLEKKLHYILVCKKESHPWLYDWVENLEEGNGKDNVHTISSKAWNGKYHLITTYQYANSVPLKDSPDSLYVNWCGITIIREEDGKILYTNSFITDYKITAETVASLVKYGRTRWKIENENNNTLKTKGYHFEHNYGHGKKYLSSLLVSLILLAFLFHTLLDLFSVSYQTLRKRFSSREVFFNDIKALTKYMYIPSWEALFSFMMTGLDHPFVIPYG